MTTTPAQAHVPVGRGHSALPTGTVTFLISDIEGSTRLLLDLGETYTHVLERYTEIIRATVAAHGGSPVSGAGDSVFAAFPTARGAVDAAVEAQQALEAEGWPDSRTVRVRIGIHTGEGTLGGNDYIGLDVHRTARISAAAHGGQVVLSAATAGLLGEGCEVTDLGEQRLKDLVHPEHLYQVAVPGLPESFPPVRSAGGILTILPVPRTGFVPRPEVDEVAALVAEDRLVTLTGPGGTGKTRLAIEASRRVKDRFPEGVVFVDLAPVLHPDLVATAIIGTIGLESRSTSAAQHLLRYLADRSMLLVLDNFEQVVDAAPLVADLVSASSEVHVLVTSRSPLRLAGEQEFPVPTLGLPDPGRSDVDALLASPAVRLFVERTRRVQPAFRLTPGNALAVAGIARRLDGLPLALELAAARARLLPPETIAARLASSGWADLAARDRDVPDRQRTLDAVISWSYDLLDEPARAAFRRLSVFSGGARLEEVEPVLFNGPDDQVIVLLEALAEQSLLRQEDADGDVRFRMLGIIGEFAAARLAESGDAVETRRRHADAYLVLAEAAAPELTGWDQRRWLDRLERDHDNLRMALDRCIAADDTERALRFAAALWRFWQIRGHLDEGRRQVDAALHLSGGDRVLRARALEAAGGIAWWRGDMPSAQQAYQEALTIVEPLDDLAATANARYNLGLTLAIQGLTDGRLQLDRARREARQAGDPRVEAWTVWGMADVGAAIGDWELTARSAEEALGMFRLLNDPFGIGWSLFMTASGHSHLGGGDLQLARDRYQEGTRLFAGFRDLPAITLHCWGLARVEAITGRPDRALRLVGASRALKARTGAGLLDVNEELLAVFDRGTTESLAASGIAETEAQRLIADGMRFSPDEAVAYILETLPQGMTSSST